VQYRSLLRDLVARDLKVRYKRSVLGIVRTMLNPLLTMLVFTMVFSHVLRVPVKNFTVPGRSASLGFFNSATTAIGNARRDVREGTLIPVPVHLRDGHYAGSERLGHGQGYQYAHDADGAVVQQDYLGVDRSYYVPTDRGLEHELSERLREIKKRLKGS
jgi:putative ATPase